MDDIDKRAFENAVVATMPSLRGFAMSLVSNSVRADDLVQDAVLSALSKREQFDGKNLTAWLFTILRNKYYSEYRKRKREVEDVDGIHSNNFAVQPDQLDVLEFEEGQQKAKTLLETIKKLLMHVPPQQRNAFWLVYAEGHSYTEVAQIEQCPEGTVKSRISRALHSLLKMVKEKGLNADEFDPIQWEAAFEGLSPISKMKLTHARQRTRGAHSVEPAGPDFVLCGLPFDLIDTLRLGSGPSTQVFRIAA